MHARQLARAAANPVAALAVTIALVGGTGVATAATGGTFILGRGNTATTRTGLTNTAGTPLSLAAKTGHPPLIVNNSVKVSRFNADLLDGLDSAALQRRVAGTCAGGAISAVGSTGTVTCAALPSKVAVTAGFGYEPTPAHTAVATVGGVTLNVACEVYDVDSLEGARLRMTGYFTGPGALVNGHVTTTPYTMVTETAPVGVQTPASGMGAALPTMDTAQLAVSRQSVSVMVVANGAVAQWTMHLFADGRAFETEDGKPCTVWGTVV